MAEGTPRPWVGRKGSNLPDTVIPPHIVREWRDAEGRKCTTFVADVRNPDDLEPIVTAVNEHDSLVRRVEVLEGR